MKLWLNPNIRKDGKFSATYGFNNGRRFKKIRTKQQLIDELQAGFNMIIEDADFNNTIRQAMGQTLYYEF